MVPAWEALLGSLLLASVHVWAGKVRFLHVVPRSRWLSFAGGVSVAYVFLRWLPEIHAGHEVLADLPVPGRIASGYVVALVGLASFYGLERWAVRSRSKARREEGADVAPPSVFWLHVSAFAVYNALIGYLLHGSTRGDAVRSVLFVLALALHFFVTDHALWAHHKHRYRARGRWVLVGAVLAGTLIGTAFRLHDVVVATASAFLAGAIILNVLKEELPEERESRFWAFACGVAGYGALLLFV